MRPGWTSYFVICKGKKTKENKTRKATTYDNFIFPLNKV